MGKKALIAMSGGVDSSGAAFLTKQAGYDCIGVTMKLFQTEDIGVSRAKTCCSLDDVEDARSVARRLGIPYYVFNFSRDFKVQVIDRFAAAYESGATPNPCIDCNRYLKFDTKKSNNARLWDTSNRAIQVVLNNLKGVFFEDDNMEHMAFSVVGRWGEKGAIMIRILDFDKSQQIRGIT